MSSSLSQMKHARRLTRQLVLCGVTAVLGSLAPTAAQAQACAAGLLSTYINPTGPGGCSIGGVNLSWGQFGLFTIDPTSIYATPLSGTNTQGSYFGFRLQSAVQGKPMLSSSITAADVRVANPNYDPNDPSFGPEFLPQIRPANFSNGFLSWRFNHSLTAPNALTRLELTTKGTQSSSVSQAPIMPSYLPNGEPDVGTGCGWSITDPLTGQTYSALQTCGFFRSASNNALWREIQDNTYAQTVWNRTGQYNYPDYLTAYCLENGASANQSTNDCTSYQDLAGVNFGSFVSLNLSQSAGAMPLFAPSTDLGLIDPNDPNFANYGASASLDEAEFRIYYQQTNIVPEPSTWALMAAGLGMVGVLARRRRTS